jgi:hypothetical protein
MLTKNFTNDRGRAIPNQFIMSEKGNGANGNFKKKEIFQSYDSKIAEKIYWDYWDNEIDIKLDSKYWDYSKTTGKYRNQFLNETKKETEAKIKSGEYVLTNLN